MFSNTSLFNKFAKFGKYNFQSRLETLFGFSIIKSTRYSNYPKVSFFNEKEINGFQNPSQLRHEFQKKKHFSHSSLVSDKKCWRCQEVLELKEFSCASCGALQYPKKDVNFFQLFGVSQTFDVDLDVLKNNFKNLQKIFHPDKFANKSEDELKISEAYSSLINKAYGVLKNPVKRGYYLLELQKAPPNNIESKAEFLNEILERNEELENIETPFEFEKFIQRNKKEINDEINLVREAFRVNQLDVVRLHLSKLQYYVSLESRIKEKQNSSISKGH